MTETGKKVDKILTWLFGAIIISAIVMMIVSIATGIQGLKVAAIIIAIAICVLSFVLDYVLKFIFSEEKTKNKEKKIEEKSENEEQ